MPKEQRPPPNGADPHPGRPPHDKGLLNTSGWWLLLWLFLVIVALWVAEQVGVFGCDQPGQHLPAAGSALRSGPQRWGGGSWMGVPSTSRGDPNNR